MKTQQVKVRFRISIVLELEQKDMLRLSEHQLCHTINHTWRR